MKNIYNIICSITLVLLSLALIVISGAWHLIEWLPPTFNTSNIYDISLNVDNEKSLTGLFGSCSQWAYDAIILDFLSPPIDIEDISIFVDNNSDNAEYNFAFGILCLIFDCGDPAHYFSEAELLEPWNPTYPFWLGLFYSKGLSGFTLLERDTLPFNSDSALAAFKRASFLEPDNSAIDLAKLNLFVLDSDTAIESFYYKNSFDQSVRYKSLTDEGREAIVDAMDKPEYRSHAGDAMTSCFSLLEDSKNNTFMNRAIIWGLIPNQRFVEVVSGLKLYVENIEKVDKEQINEVVDTLLGLSNIGLLMRDDPEMTLHQLSMGNLITKLYLNILGDLYQKNDLPTYERIIGYSIATSENLRNQIWKGSKWMIWNYNQHYFPFLSFMIISQMVILILVPFFLILLAILLITENKQQAKLSLRLWRSIVFLGGITLSLIIFFSINVKDNIRPYYLIFLGLLIVLNLVFLNKRIYKNQNKPGTPLILVLFTAFFIVAFLAVFLKFPMLIFLGFPFAIVISSFVATKDYKKQSPAVIHFCLRSSAELISLFSLIIVALWFIAAPYITSFVNNNQFSYPSYLYGPSISEEIDPPNPEADYGIHYSKFFIAKRQKNENSVSSQ